MGLYVGSNFVTIEDFVFIQGQLKLLIILDMNNIISHTIECSKKSISDEKYYTFIMGYVSDDDISTKTCIETEGIKYYNKIGSIAKICTASLFTSYDFNNKVTLNDSLLKDIEEFPANHYYPDMVKLATHSSGYSSLFSFSNIDEI